MDFKFRNCLNLLKLPHSLEVNIFIFSNKTDPIICVHVLVSRQFRVAFYSFYLQSMLLVTVLMYILT